MNTILRIFWRALVTHLSLTLARPVFQITLVAQPIVMATITAMISGETASQRVDIVVIGAGLAGIWSSIVFSSAGDINRERFYGTLSTVFCSPASLLVVMLGKIAGNGLLAIGALLISVLYSWFALGLPLTIPQPGRFTLALLMFVTTSNLFALSLSALFLLSRSTTLLQNFLEYPIYIVSGIFFPLDILPPFIRPFGWLLPLTWTRQALSLSLIPNGNVMAFWRAIGFSAVMLVFYWLLAVVFFRLIERRVRVTATLDIA